MLYASSLICRFGGLTAPPSHASRQGMGYVYACVEIPVVDQPAFRASELPSVDSGNMPASVVELGVALFKLCPFIPELELWVFWAPNFYKTVGDK